MKPHPRLVQVGALAALFSVHLVQAQTHAPTAPAPAPPTAPASPPASEPASPPASAPPAAPGSAPASPPTAAPPARSTQPPAEPPKPPAAAHQKVEVTGGRESDTDQRRQSTAAKIIIGRDEIEKFGDASVGEVLRRLPGVTTPGAPGRGGGPRLRGLGGGFTQLLIDGQRMPPGFSLDSLTPEQLERIEILRAPTAETGARAIAGTINIITREGYTKRLNDLRIGAGVENGKPSTGSFWSHNDSRDQLTYTLSAGLFGSQRKNSSSSLTRVTDDASGELLEDRSGRNLTQGHHIGLNLGARLQWRLGEGGDSLTLMPGLFSNRSENRTAFTLDERLRRPDAPERADYGHSSSESSFFGPRLMLQYRQRMGEWRLEGGGQLRASQARSHSTRDEFSCDDGRDSSCNESRAGGSPLRAQDDRTRTRERELNLNGKARRLLGAEGSEHSLVLGAEIEGARRADTQTTTASSGVPLDDSSPLSAESGNFEASTLRMAAYAQDEWELNANWAFHAGLRWEGIHTRGDNGQGEQPVNRNSVWTPLVHLLWKPDPSKRDQVRLSLTRSWRAPNTNILVGRRNFNRLYDPLVCKDGPDRPGNVETSPDNAGNPLLQPELATGIDLAFERYLSGGGLLSSNLFVRRIRDLMRPTTEIEEVSWSACPRWVRRTRNIGNALTTGLELEAKFRLDQWISDATPVELRANLSLYRSRVDAVPGPDNRLDQQARATGNFGADYRFRGLPITLGGNLNWVPATLTRLAADETSKVGTKRQWDMFLLWSINPGVGLRLMGSNLLAQDYVTESSNGSQRSDTGGRQTTQVISTSPSYINWQLRLELKL